MPVAVRVPQNPSEFWEALYRRAVREVLCLGAKLEDAEDASQTAVLYTWNRADIYNLPIPKIYCEVGRMDTWRWRDGIRKRCRITPLPQLIDEGGEQIVGEPPANEYDADRHIFAHQLFDLAKPRFERGMKRALRDQPSLWNLYRAVMSLADRICEPDPLTRWTFARTIVFTGRGSEKRDSTDVTALAGKLRKSPGAVATALTRIQEVWLAVEVASFEVRVGAAAD